MQSILRPTSPKTNLANSVPRQIEEKEKHIDKSQAQTGRTTNPFDIVSSFRQPYTTPFDPTLAGVEVTPSALLPISRAVTDATSVHRPLHSRDGTLDFTNGGLWAHNTGRNITMPPQLSRFQSGPNNVAPYQHQFAGLAQGHSANYPPQLGTPSHLNPNAQIPSFATNGNVLGLGGGMNSAAAAGFGVGPDTGLASQAARMGFHSATLQHQQHAQQQSHSVMGDHPARTQLAKGRIREVWKHNLEEEMAVLRELVLKYPYIAMVS